MKHQVFSACLVGIAGCLLWNACMQAGQEPISKPSKSTLVYMVADNNLDYYGVKNIKEFISGGIIIFSNKTVFQEGKR